MKILIIEDEDVAARNLQRLIKEYDENYIICATLKSISSSIDWFSKNPIPDLIFMDIQLSDGKCFDIFKQITVSAPIIFTTAYDEYAIKAFEVNSIDYLLKPISKEKLTKAINKFKQLFNNEQYKNSIINLISDINQVYKDRFLVKIGQQLVSVKDTDIAYFLKEELVFIITNDNNKYPIDYNLDNLEKVLNKKRFFRLNRQIISNISSIDKIHQYFKGRLKVELNPKAEIEIIISQNRVNEFKSFMGK